MPTRLARFTTLRTVPLHFALLVSAACGPMAPPGGGAAPASDSATRQADGAASASGAAAQAFPDLSGVWMAFAVENPDGGNAPRYSAEGRAALDAYAGQFREIPETGAYCVGTGMPSVMLSTVSYPIELVQTASRIVMVAELETQVRRVFLDGRSHPDDFLPTGVGHSIGSWEGDTLVIDTTLLEEWQLRPWPRSEQTRIVERVRLTKLDQVTARATGFVASVEAPINDDVLVFDMTLTDPALYDGPQRRVAYYQRMSDTATLEYACVKELWREELERQRNAQ
jgi:hypothetical protein